MSPDEDELRLACERCVASLASRRDADAVRDAVALLAFPSVRVIGQLAGAVLALADDADEQTLASIESRRLPESGVVLRTVHALRAGDVAALLRETGTDAVGVYVHLASAAAALNQD